MPQAGAPSRKTRSARSECDASAIDKAETRYLGQITRKAAEPKLDSLLFANNDTISWLQFLSSGKKDAQLLQNNAVRGHRHSHTLTTMCIISLSTATHSASLLVLFSEMAVSTSRSTRLKDMRSIVSRTCPSSNLGRSGAFRPAPIASFTAAWWSWW